MEHSKQFGPSAHAERPVLDRPVLDYAHGCSEHDEYDYGTAEETRRILHRDSSVGIPEIDVAAFVSYLLPPLRDGISIEDVISCLREDGFITPNDRWNHFEAAPAAKAEEEDVVFAPLAEISRRSTYFASKAAGLESTVVLSLLSNCASREENWARPDGYFILKEADDRAQLARKKKEKVRWWHDIALTAEFKREENIEDLDDNVSRLVFSMQQTMTFDASRRFTFGITIENTTMRLWFCSRATFIVSKPFDFTTELNLLTRVFVSFAFGSKEELGWDPTVHSFLGSDGQRQYEIDVGDNKYVTEQVLSDSAADSLLGRATRVWKGKSAASGEPIVLKDVWIEDDCFLEHEIYSMILADVEKEFGINIRKEVASHLITPEASWLVTINGEQDHTTRLVMRGYEPSLKDRFRFKVKEPRGTNASNSNKFGVAIDLAFFSARRGLKAPFPLCFHRRKLVRRRHYRIVFKEVAVVLYSIRAFSDFFSVLRDVARVLKWIHGCGWVHRDISMGNLYFHEGRGLIGDLEYAKRTNVEVSREHRIGTRESMAPEAASRCYLYHYDKEDEDIDIDAEIGALLAEGSGRVDLNQDLNQEPPFFHNDLHDLESLWWVAIWELFFHQDAVELGSEDEQALERDLQRESIATQLFSKTDAVLPRLLFVKNRMAYESRVAWMPDNLRNIKGVLSTLRELLHCKYAAFEAQFPAINMDIFVTTQERFGRLFEVCRSFATGIELVPYKTIGQRYPFARDWDAREVPRDMNVPSLEQDSGGEGSDDSLPDFDMDTQELWSQTNDPSAATAESVRKPWSGADVYLTPVPLLRAERYELEVC